MLCTVVLDTYRWDDRKAVWRALRTLLPCDGNDWSCKGLYVYWDPATHEMLYTGLAGKLAERFAQHNGLIPHTGGNKLKNIRAWFQEHPRIGFTVLLQAAGVEVLDVIDELSVTLGASSDDIIKAAEGQVIELHRLERGHRPLWNDVGGAIRGQEWAVETERSLIRVLTAETDSLFVARSTVRDLAADEEAQRHEVTIHGGRIHALMAAHEVTIHGGRIRALMAAQQGGMPEDSKEVSRLILKSFMLRYGHLIDDLSVSDAQIIDRLRQIEDGRVLSEYQEMRASLEKMAPDIKIDGDRQVALMQYVMAMCAELDHPAQAAAVTGLFHSDYLSRCPNLAFDG